MRDLNYQLKQLCRRNNDGGYATRVNREQQLKGIADLLYELGYRRMTTRSLKPKHVEALVKHWLAQELSAGTIKNRMSCLRWWAEKVNKQNTIARRNDFYGIPDRQFIAQESKAKSLPQEQLDLIIRLKADSYNAKHKPLQPDRSWKEAVLRYVGELDNDNRRIATRDHLRQLDPFLAEFTLNKINMESLRPFMRHRKEVDGVSNATVNRALEIVRRILHLARDEWEWLDSFPRIRMLREPKCLVRYLSRQEADVLLEALPAHLRPVVAYGLATGCRMGEILNLEWHRVDFDRRVAWLDHGTTKNGEGRGIPLNNDAILALRAVEGIHDRWCFTYRKTRMDRVGSGWKRALKRVGITNFRFHDLRHTWASWHVTNGTSLQELMELGGWKSYEMVLRYAHLAPDHLSHAAARIERELAIVGPNPTKTLRSFEEKTNAKA